MKKKTKRKLVYGSIAVLGAVAVTMVSAAAVTAVKRTKTNAPETADVAIEAQLGTFVVDQGPEDRDIDFEKELKPDIDEIIKDIKSRCGGEWSVYVYVPATEDTLSINQKKMQAASVIKLFVMGAVYEEYDALKKDYEWTDIDELIESMITISDNEAADQLVLMLGRGDAVSGRKKVNDYCKKLGLQNTSMDRMMGDDNILSDNYTSTEDTGIFLSKILKGELPESKMMLKYLQAQTRTTKIPEGLPNNVTTANKTGELDDVQNDAAIVFAGRPYIICVMSDGVGDYQPPIDAITDISKTTYNYLAPKLVSDDAD